MLAKGCQRQRRAVSASTGLPMPAIVKNHVYVAQICNCKILCFLSQKFANARSSLAPRDTWRSPLARQLLPPCYKLIITISRSRRREGWLRINHDSSQESLEIQEILRLFKFEDIISMVRRSLAGATPPSVMVSNNTAKAFTSSWCLAFDVWWPQK